MIFKSVKVKKVKKRLRNCSRLKETKENHIHIPMRYPTWILYQGRMKDLIGTIDGIWNGYTDKLSPINAYLLILMVVLWLYGLPKWLGVKEFVCQCRRHKRCRFNPLEKEMATHSSIVAGKFHGQRSLVGYSPWTQLKWLRTMQNTMVL